MERKEKTKVVLQRLVLTGLLAIGLGTMTGCLGKVDKGVQCFIDRLTTWVADPNYESPACKEYKKQ